jgi:hypothetical protein
LLFERIASERFDPKSGTIGDDVHLTGQQTEAIA